MVGAAWHHQRNIIFLNKLDQNHPVDDCLLVGLVNEEGKGLLPAAQDGGDALWRQLTLKEVMKVIKDDATFVRTSFVMWDGGNHFSAFSKASRAEELKEFIDNSKPPYQDGLDQIIVAAMEHYKKNKNSSSEGSSSQEVDGGLEQEMQRAEAGIPFLNIYCMY